MSVKQILAIYLRQSKDAEGNELAIDRQLAACMKLVVDKGLDKLFEVVVYRDNDRSASNGKLREGYQRMLKDIAAGSVAWVIVYHQDRLHRDVMELLVFAELAVEHNLKLASVTGDIDLSTDDGEFMAIIGAAVARKEVRRKAARQKDAARQRATQEGGGRPWWTQRPFGFDADPDPVTGKWWTAKRNPTIYNEIRLHTTEAPLLQAAYSDFNNGTSLYTIAARWNDAGVTTPLGNRWSGARVRDQLLLARNAGLREYNGEVVGEGTWPPIVTEAVWRAACAKLTEPSRRRGPTRGRKYLLSGIARCGACGSALTSHISVRGTRHYTCKTCFKVTRQGQKLDQVITAAVVDRLSREDAVDLLLPDAPEVDTDALREQRRALEEGLARLGKEFAKAPASFVQSALDDINGQLAVINAQLDDPGKVNIFEGVIGAEDVGAAFGSLDLGRQRTIVDALLVINVRPVGKLGTKAFVPDAIDVAWRDDN